MLLFLDTEFTGFATRQLISLALVSVDGLHEFYVELSDFDRGICDPFVVEEVLPQLGQTEAAMCNNEEASCRLRVWLRQFGEVFCFASDSETDYQLLRELLSNRGRDLPHTKLSWLNVGYLDEQFAEDADRQCPARETAAHHALLDARALRTTWLSRVPSESREKYR